VVFALLQVFTHANMAISTDVLMTGVVFALHQFESKDVVDKIAVITGVRNWLSGYSAKTEVSFMGVLMIVYCCGYIFTDRVCSSGSPVQY
jgi:hypothetical protein